MIKFSSKSLTIQARSFNFLWRKQIFERSCSSCPLTIQPNKSPNIDLEWRLNCSDLCWRSGYTTKKLYKTPYNVFNDGSTAVPPSEPAPCTLTAPLIQDLFLKLRCCRTKKISPWKTFGRTASQLQSELCLFCLVMNCTDTKRQTNCYTREDGRAWWEI